MKRYMWQSNVKTSKNGMRGSPSGSNKNRLMSSNEQTYFLTQEHRRNYAIVPTCTTEVEGRSRGEKTIIQTYTNITM